MNAIMLITATPDGRIFGLDQQTFISVAIQLFNACLLAVALSFILYKPVRKFLKKRADGITAQLKGAEQDVAKANELKAMYEQKLEELEAERLEILESAHDLAEEKSKDMLHDAEKQAAAVKKQAAADIQTERERASEEIRLHIIDVASAMAEKFVAHTIDVDTRNRLFDETIAQLEGAAWDN